jgi:hypothetical protein
MLRGPPPECPVDAAPALAPVEFAPIWQDSVELSIMSRIFMHNKQAGSGALNSAANPLPTAPNSVAGRRAKTPPKALIYKAFLTLRYLDLAAETRIFPDLREKPTR